MRWEWPCTPRTADFFRTDGYFIRAPVKPLTDLLRSHEADEQETEWEIQDAQGQVDAHRRPAVLARQLLQPRRQSQGFLRSGRRG